MKYIQVPFEGMRVVVPEYFLTFHVKSIDICLAVFCIQDIKVCPLKFYKSLCFSEKVILLRRNSYEMLLEVTRISI